MTYCWLQRKIVRAVSISFVSFCFLVPAAAAEGYFFDGNDWKRFASIMKISYISGLYDGGAFFEVNLRRENCDDIASIARRFPMDMPFKDVVAALDDFYRQVDNSPIPIVYAIYIIKMQRDEVSPDEIGQYKKRLFGILGKLP